MKRNFLVPLVFCIAVPLLTLEAEIPLPDAIVYGPIRESATSFAELVAAGRVTAIVERQGLEDLEVPAELSSDGASGYYVFRIPMETSNVTDVGSNPRAACDGDVLVEIRRDDEPLETESFTLSSGSVQIGPTLPEEAGVRFVRGDCNADQTVVISDPVFLLQFLFLGGPRPPCADACNANGDSRRSDISDALYTLNFLFLGGPRIPAPYPDCGLGPEEQPDCESFPPCEGGGGGGVALPVSAGSDASLTFSTKPAGSLGALAAAAAPLAGGDGLDVALGKLGERGRGDHASLGIDEGKLSVTPAVLHFGAIGSQRVTKSLTVTSNSDLPLEIDLGSSSARFSVSPSRFQLPPGGSLVALVDARADEDPGPQQEATVEIRTEGLLLRVDIDEASIDGPVALRAGDAARPAGNTTPIALPIELRSALALDRVVLTLSVDGLEALQVLPVDGVVAEDVQVESPGTVSATLTGRLGSGGPAVVAHLVVSPPRDLRAGTYSVLISEARVRDASGREIHVSTTHGEICYQREWLDLDGDGAVSPGYEALLASRYFSGEPTLIPEHWGVPERAGDLTDELSRRLPYLDVDGSGAFDAEDLGAVVSSLGGLRPAQAEVRARARNLHVRGHEQSAFRPGEIRVPAAVRERGLQGGGRVMIPLSLDTADPLGGLDVLVASRSPGLALIGFHGSGRLDGARMETVGGGEMLEIHISSQGGTTAPIPQGLGALGVLEADLDAQAESVTLEIESETEGVSGETVTLPVRGDRSPGLALEGCQRDDGGRELAVRVSLGGETGANHLGFLLRYPGELVSLESLELLSPYRERARVLHEADDLCGEIRVIAYQPEGLPLSPRFRRSQRTREGGAEPLLELSFKARGDTGIGGASFEALDVVGHRGPRKVIFRGDTLVLADFVGDPCEPREEGCPAGEARLDLSDALSILDYLFLGGPGPACPGDCDKDCDGRLTIRDAARVVEEYFGS